MDVVASHLMDEQIIIHWTEEVVVLICENIKTRDSRRRGLVRTRVEAPPPACN
jgi:hypothetical protein